MKKFKLLKPGMMVYNRKEHEIYNTHKGDYDSMERYDIAIIGTGPAGLSAAVTAAIRKKILLVGSREFKQQGSEGPGNPRSILVFPISAGQAGQGAFGEHIDRMRVPLWRTGVKI